MLTQCSFFFLAKNLDLNQFSFKPPYIRRRMICIGWKMFFQLWSKQNKICYFLSFLKTPFINNCKLAGTSAFIIQINFLKEKSVWQRKDRRMQFFDKKSQNIVKMIIIIFSKYCFVIFLQYLISSHKTLNQFLPGCKQASFQQTFQNQIDI